MKINDNVMYYIDRFIIESDIKIFCVNRRRNVDERKIRDVAIGLTTPHNLE